MALDPVIQATADWMSEVVREYAKSKAWSAEDYRIFMTTNDDWGAVNFIVVVKGLDSVSLKSNWLALWDTLQRRAKDEAPHPMASIGLVLRSNEQMQEGGLYRIHPSYYEITTLPGVTTVEGTLPSPNAR